MKPAIPRFLTDLSRFVPAVTCDQLQREYFRAKGKAALIRALETAEAKGFIEVGVKLVRPRETTQPIAVIRQGELLPDPHKVAYAASKRWEEAMVPTLVVQGTARLAAVCGGLNWVVASGHLSHEIALSEVFFQKRRADPSFEWSLVSQSGARGGGRVDAISGNLLVELVGRYSGAGVEGKIRLAGQATLELW